MATRVDVLDALAARHGFSLVGLTSGAPLADALEALARWCAAGHHGAMGYMARDPKERADPRTLLEDVRTVLCVAVDHFNAAPPFESEARYGRIARYAWGRDYHDVMIPRLSALARELVARLGGARAAVAVDHSPLLERAAAARAGLGFQGKNTCLILPRRGSHVFLGEILLDVELPATTAPRSEGCGACVRCLVACPTDAFVSPWTLDARRCISYLTIEHRGAIPREIRSRLASWVFGCDDCQDVCPYNRFSVETTWEELGPKAGVGPRLDLEATLSIATDEAFRRRFAGTALLRPRRAGLLRNAAIAARNVGAARCVPILETLADEDPESVVRAHALWALGGLDPSRARRVAETARTRDPDAGVRGEAAALLEGAAGDESDGVGR